MRTKILSIIQKVGETIIVDCGSKDKTIDVANIYGAKVYISKERNRKVFDRT